jgi:CheY-like chemotaxis protein
VELQQAITTMLYPEEDMPLVPSRRSHGSSLLKEKPMVLVIEDNPDNMVTVRALLSDRYTVLEAVNAQEGLLKAKEFVPALILMDIALPDFSGIDAFKKIRRMPQTQHIPVIALTASVMKHDRETILSQGFDAFIGKPIIADEFHTIIGEVLHGK